MKSHAEHIYDLAFISDRLKSIFDRNAGTDAMDIPIRDIIEFRRQLRAWDRKFPRAPRKTLINCRIDELQRFYTFKLDFSIFEKFPPVEQNIIREEIAAYAAREALDSFVGYRWRNLAGIGIVNPRWHQYLTEVREYYNKVVPPARKERIAKFQEEMTKFVDSEIYNIAGQCMGELFFEVNRIRLMSGRALEAYLNEIREAILSSKRRHKRVTVSAPPPESVRACFDFLGLSYPVERYELKNRYRELARNSHPDKGGSDEDMQQLNAAYRIAVKYISRHQEG